MHRHHFRRGGRPCAARFPRVGLRPLPNPSLSDTRWGTRPEPRFNSIVDRNGCDVTRNRELICGHSGHAPTSGTNGANRHQVRPGGQVWPRIRICGVKGVAADSGRKLRVPGNQPGTGVNPPITHHRREHCCHGRLRRPMLRQRDAPYPRPSLDLGLRLFLRGWLCRMNPMACKREPRRHSSGSKNS